MNGARSSSTIRAAGDSAVRLGGQANGEQRGGRCGVAQVPVSRETIDWLLSEENPPVRYLTLTRLLGEGDRSRRVREAKARLGEYAPTRKILAQRRRFWSEGSNLYQKYGGGYWQLIFLGEFLAPRDLPGVEEGVERVLGSRGSLIRERPWFGIHCLNSNILRALVALGFADDPRVREGLDHVAREIVAAEGVPCHITDWSIYPTCRMTLPKVLLAMTSLPARERTPSMVAAERISRDLLLAHEVTRYVSPYAKEFIEHFLSLPRGTPRSISIVPEKREAIRKIKRDFVRKKGGLGQLKDKAGWLRFGFPLHYNSDALEAMIALAQAQTPAGTAQVAHAIEAIRARRRPDGRWPLDFTHNGKMIVDIEKKGAPSRWITYRALFVLKHFAGLEFTA